MEFTNPFAPEIKFTLALVTGIQNRNLLSQIEQEENIISSYHIFLAINRAVYNKNILHKGKYLKKDIIYFTCDRNKMESSLKLHQVQPDEGLTYYILLIDRNDLREIVDKLEGEEVKTANYSNYVNIEAIRKEFSISEPEMDTNGGVLGAVYNQTQNAKLSNMANKVTNVKQKEVLSSKQKDIELEKFTQPEYIRQLCLEHNKKFNDDLEIINFINSGSCGYVFEGKIRKHANKRVALKFIISKANEAKREQKLKSMKKEIQLHNKLKCKHIANLFGVYEIADNSCIVLEYAKYGDLDHFQKLIQKKIINETLSAYLAKQILIALRHCHSSGIVHMDVKQANILIDENLNVKISDFSVSYDYSLYSADERCSLPLAGTSLFMSVEVLSKAVIGVKHMDRIDTYSLGVLLYYLSFGFYPYGLTYEDKRNFKVIEEKIRTNELIIPDNKKHSKMFREFLKGLLDKNIETRFGSEEALAHKWMKCANEIFLEKEKISDLEKFLINVVTDNVKSFNDILKKRDEED